MKEQCREWGQFFLTLFNTLVLVVLGIDYLKPVHHTFQNFQPHSRVIFDSGTLITAPNANISNGPTEYQPLAIVTGYSPVDVAIVIGADKTAQTGYLQSYYINGTAMEMVMNPNGGAVKTKNSVLDNGYGAATFVNVTVSNTLTANNAAITSLDVSQTTVTNLTASYISSPTLEVTNITVTGTLTATNVSASNLHTVDETVTGTLTAPTADITSGTIATLDATQLNAVTLNITSLQTTNVTVSDSLTAASATINILNVTNQLTATTLNATTVYVTESLTATNTTVLGVLDATSMNSHSLSATNATIDTLTITSSLTAAYADILSGTATVSELVVNGVNITQNGGLPATQYIGVQYYYEKQSTNVAAGDTIAGGWYERTLQTVGTGNLDTVTTSLSANVITLQAGTYSIEASVPADNANGFQARLWDITAGAVLAYGTSALSSGSQTRSDISTVVTVASGTTKQIRVEAAYSVNVTGGLGTPANVGGAYEIYTVVKVTQLDQPTNVEFTGDVVLNNLVVSGTATVSSLTVTSTLYVPTGTGSTASFIYRAFNSTVNWEEYNSTTSTWVAGPYQPCTFVRSGNSVVFCWETITVTGQNNGGPASRLADTSLEKDGVNWITYASINGATPQLLSLFFASGVVAFGYTTGSTITSGVYNFTWYGGCMPWTL